MPEENPVEIKPEVPATDKPKIGQDVYDDARKFNLRIALAGTSASLALNLATKSNLVTAVGGIVLGGFGFFGNRNYRNKGDDSTYAYMGELLGATQLVASFGLLAAEGLITQSNDSSEYLASFKMIATVCGLMIGTSTMVNAFLYSDGIPKNAPAAPKMKPE